MKLLSKTILLQVLIEFVEDSHLTAVTAVFVDSLPLSPPAAVLAAAEGQPLMSLHPHEDHYWTGSSHSQCHSARPHTNKVLGGGSRYTLSRQLPLDDQHQGRGHQSDSDDTCCIVTASSLYHLK